MNEHETENRQRFNALFASYGPDIALIDHHDLNPGQREESVFVVRDRSTGLLDAVNAFVTRTPFPLHLAR